MKTLKSIFFLICLILVSKSYSQVRIGGEASIDISINIPIPDVAIERRNDSRVVKKPSAPVIHNCNHLCSHNENVSYGEIQNQNGPYGRQIYQVTQARLESNSLGSESVIYQLNSGDVLELIVVTANIQDFNYHNYGENCDCLQQNRIVKVLLNHQQIQLRDGSLSLQPKGNGFHSVINLHTEFEGDFNGTVNF
ncbi:hypothetical protein SAMN04487910_0473 [Aquimarina amphilecti]|uniref:Uncharacterized protein n=1 Tax=Aquimarina amphilecti TaxID=1038014 RepID=A0A1H7GVM1_AQUAM|nr:hypothetical protein [Aquimarina amphilecti]SEK41547.1 hypothetical protein SAMN04487910_0473 [Aquimarina amphilecti]